MRVVQIILGTIGMLMVTTQSIRHVYVLWIEPRTSVLDEFRTKTEQDIDKTTSLEELRTLYAQAHEKVQKLDEDAKNLSGDARDDWRWQHRDEYQSEQSLENAIRLREEHSRQTLRLQFFWFCGLGSSLLGCVCYLWRDQWLGMAGIIAGFVEMLWWTHPSYRAFGAAVEFDRLLLLKLIYSIITLLLLVGLWLMESRRIRVVVEK